MQMSFDLNNDTSTTDTSANLLPDEHRIIYDLVLATLKRPLHTSYERQAGNFSAIRFFKQRVIRTYIGKKVKYLLIYSTPQSDEDDESTDDIKPMEDQEPDKPIRYDLPATLTHSLDLSDLSDTFNDLWKLADENAKVRKFGCCNDFERCSDAGNCLHETDIELWGCYYRKNLENGRIFYGKNKNA